MPHAQPIDSTIALYVQIVFLELVERSHSRHRQPARGLGAIAAGILQGAHDKATWVRLDSLREGQRPGLEYGAPKSSITSSEVNATRRSTVFSSSRSGRVCTWQPRQPDGARPHRPVNPMPRGRR